MGSVRDCTLTPTPFGKPSKVPDAWHRKLSKGLEQRFVLRMRTDPEPNQRVGLEHGDGSRGEIHPNRIDGQVRMNLLEPQRRVGRVLRPLTVCGFDAGLTLRRCGSEQQPEPFGRYRIHRSSRAFVRPARYSVKASEARASRMCPDVAKDCDQRCSEEISSSRIAASMSCSSGGSLVASATADARACVMLSYPEGWQAAMVVERRRSR